MIFLELPGKKIKIKEGDMQNVTILLRVGDDRDNK